MDHGADRILEMRWFPGEMTDGAFKASLALFAWQAEQIRVSLLLIDATQFRHRSGADVMQWRDSFIIPRYGAAGTKKFAFHVPEGAPNTVEAGGKKIFDGPAISQPLGSANVRTRSIGSAKARVPQEFRRAQASVDCGHVAL